MSYKILKNKKRCTYTIIFSLIELQSLYDSRYLRNNIIRTPVLQLSGTSYDNLFL